MTIAFVCRHSYRTILVVCASQSPKAFKDQKKNGAYWCVLNLNAQHTKRKEKKKSNIQK
jgi:hypothetical protein